MESGLKLEALLPQALLALFPSSGPDPLADVPVGQLRLLRLLMRSPLTGKELAHRLELSCSALTQMANRMERAGLIVREEDASDGRVRWIRLSEKAEEMLRRRIAWRSASAAHRLQAMEPARIEALIELLESLISSSELVDRLAPTLRRSESEHGETPTPEAPRVSPPPTR